MSRDLERQHVNTHYGVLVYAGDLDGTVDGHGPEMTLIAAGDEDHCWRALKRWTAEHALRPGESAEVVARINPVARPSPASGD